VQTTYLTVMRFVLVMLSWLYIRWSGWWQMCC